MRRRTYLRFTGLAGVTSLTGCLGDRTGNPDSSPTDTGTVTPTTDTVAEEDQMTFGGIINPPYVTQGESEGTLSGFEVDLLTTGFGDSDAQIEAFSSYDASDGLMGAINEGSVDIGGGHLKVGDVEGITFQPFYSADQTILVRRDGNFTPDEFSDFNGKTVAAEAGSEGAAAVNSQLIEPGVIAESEFIVTDSQKAALVSLENGEVDAAFFDRPLGLSFESTRDVKVEFRYDTGVEYGYATRTADEKLRERIDRAVQRSRLNGGFQELVIDHFAPDE